MKESIEYDRNADNDLHKYHYHRNTNQVSGQGGVKEATNWIFQEQMRHRQLNDNANKNFQLKGTQALSYSR